MAVATLDRQEDLSENFPNQILFQIGSNVWRILMHRVFQFSICVICVGF